MKKALVIYGSETGNTRRAASLVAEVLEEKGWSADIRDVTDTDSSALSERFDLYLLGVSTWGAVDEEVTEDFKEFYDEMSGLDLSGKRFAVFGCGDSGYEHFAKAVDFVAERAAERGAEIVGERLKIDQDPSDAEEAVQSWAEEIAEAV